MKICKVGHKGNLKDAFVGAIIGEQFLDPDQMKWAQWLTVDHDGMTLIWENQPVILEEEMGIPVERWRDPKGGFAQYIPDYISSLVATRRSCDLPNFDTREAIFKLQYEENNNEAANAETTIGNPATRLAAG